jgi:hypothetical protein
LGRRNEEKERELRWARGPTDLGGGEENAIFPFCDLWGFVIKPKEI